jgi:hypothetical protein
MKKTPLLFLFFLPITLYSNNIKNEALVVLYHQIDFQEKPSQYSIIAIYSDDDVRRFQDKHALQPSTFISNAVSFINESGVMKTLNLFAIGIAAHKTVEEDLPAIRERFQATTTLIYQSDSKKSVEASSSGTAE